MVRHHWRSSAPVTAQSVRSPDDRQALEAAGAELVPTRGLRFLDPWGNSVEVVQYDEIQFSKTDAVLDGMGVGRLGKTDAARAELREKGLGP